MTNIQSTHLDLSIPTSYSLEPCQTTTRGLLVLHGYSDLGRSVRKRLLGMEPVPGYTVLVPNGIFPCPVEKEDGFKEAYSWYFKDPKTGIEMISPEFAAEALLKLILKLKLEALEWTTLGFSQGGFFAPYLIHKGINSKRIISVGAAYQSKSWQGLKNIRIDAIHGEQDEAVPYSIATSSFHELTKLGYTTQFHSISKLGHTLNEDGRKIVRQILSE